LKAKFSELKTVKSKISETCISAKMTLKSVNCPELIQ